MKKSEISAAVSAAVSQDNNPDSKYFEVDKDPLYWQTLTDLKNELGNAMITFCVQVQTIATNPEIRGKLGDRLPEFERLEEAFKTDIDRFGAQIQSLRELYEHKTGMVDNLDDYGLYQRVWIEFNNAMMELHALMGPIISSMFLIINQVMPKETQDAFRALTEEENAQNVNVVTDAEVKNVH